MTYLKLTLIAVLGLATASCAGMDSDDAPTFDHAALVRELEKLGARVEARGAVSQPFFSVSGQTIAANGHEIQTFEYRNSAAAEREARTVSPDGSTVGTTSVSWVAAPHFYRRDSLDRALCRW